MKYIFYFLFLFIILIGCNSDSDKKSIQLQESRKSLDSSTLKILHNSIKKQRRLHQLDSLRVYAIELENLSLEKSNEYYHAESNYYQGYYQYENHKVDSSYYYFNKARSGFQKIHDSLGIIKSKRGIALSQTMVGDYLGAKQTSLSILKFIPKNDYSLVKSEVFLILGFTSTIQKNYQQALDYYDQALKDSIAEKSKLEVLNNMVHNHIMLGEKDAKHYDAASKILDELESNTYGLIKAKILTDFLDNKGYLLFKLNQHEEALVYMTEALNMRKKENSLYGMMFSYQSLMEYYEKKNPSKSIQYADSLYNISTQLNYYQSRLQALQYKMKLIPTNKVKDYVIEYKNLRDSIDEVREKSINKFAKIRFEITEKRNENDLLKTELIENEIILKRNKNIRTIIIIGIIFFILMLVYYYRHQFVKNQRKLSDEIQKAEQKLSSKVHDELANSIYLTISYIDNLKSIEDLSIKQKLIEKLDKVYKLSKDISRESQLIKTNHLYPKEIFSLISYYKTDSTNIILIGFEDQPWSKVSKLSKLHFYKILQELLTNMKKHSQSTLVSLKFEFLSNKIEFTYSDNGVGISNETYSPSNGLQNITNRLDIMKGKGEILPSSRGFKYFLSFPIDNPKR